MRRYWTKAGYELVLALNLSWAWTNNNKQTSAHSRDSIITEISLVGDIPVYSTIPQIDPSIVTHIPYCEVCPFSTAGRGIGCRGRV